MLRRDLPIRNGVGMGQGLRDRDSNAGLGCGRTVVPMQIFNLHTLLSKLLPVMVWGQKYCMGKGQDHSEQGGDGTRSAR